jgi:hypothetical protein
LLTIKEQEILEILAQELRRVVLVPLEALPPPVRAVVRVRAAAG